MLQLNIIFKLEGGLKIKCEEHPDKEAIAACVICGRGICEDCRLKLAGKNYCQECADELVAEKIEEDEKKDENKINNRQTQIEKSHDTKRPDTYERPNPQKISVNQYGGSMPWKIICIIGVIFILVVLIVAYYLYITYSPISFTG